MSEPVKGQRELAFGDYFRLLVKGRYILLFSVASFLGPTWWFIKRLPEYYITSSQLVMDEKSVNPTSLMLDNSSSTKNIGYYRAIFQSKAFLDRMEQGAAADLAKAGIKGRLKEFITQNVSMGEGSVESFITISSKTNSAT